MEAGTGTFSDFIQYVKRAIAHILAAFYSSALGLRAHAFLEDEAKKFNTKADDPRFLVNVLVKRWKQDFERHLPLSTELPIRFEKVRNLFNIDAHSSQESWVDINYYVDNLLAGLHMFAAPGPYFIDTAATIASIKELWSRVDKTGKSLNSDFQWALRDVYLPGLDNDDLSVIVSGVAESITSDLVESSLSITLGISPSSCKKLPDGCFEVSFASAKDLNDCLNHGADIRIKNKPVSVCKKQVTKEVKYVIKLPPSDISIDVIKSGIEINLDLKVIAITKNLAGELEIVFPPEVTFEKEEVTIRKQKVPIIRAPLSRLSDISASSPQRKILLYGVPIDYDTHKIESALDNILDVKCNAIKSEDDTDLAVLLLCREEDPAIVLNHNNRKLPVAKSIAYCEHVLKLVDIPIGTKIEHISSALAGTDCQIVYYNDKQKTGYIHCIAREVKERLLLRKTLPLLAAKPAIKSDQKIPPNVVFKPDPLPTVIAGTTASFTDSNEFVSVVSGNGMTDISFSQKGDLSRIQAKGFSHITAICDAKSIKYTIIDGTRMQLSTAIPGDVKEVMNTIRDLLKDRAKDRVTVGEVERCYTPIFKSMARHFTNVTNCVVTVGANPGKLNNQHDFVELFLFGFKADNEALKQVLNTFKRPCSQDMNISADDLKLLADIPEVLDLIQNQYFVDFAMKDEVVTVRALSVQLREQAWQATLAELKQRKEATKLQYPHCIVDYFDNYMLSDFQKDMFQKQLAGVTILTRGDSFIFNGPHSVVERVKAELQDRLAKLSSKNWSEQIDTDLARHLFSTKKVQQFLRENEVSYFFFGKTRSVQSREKPEPKKPVNTSPVRRNKERALASKKIGHDNAKKSINKYNKNNKNNKKNNRSNDTPKNFTHYFNKNVQLRDISFVCQDANKLSKCLDQLKGVLLIQSVPMDINYSLTKFIIQNIKDIESKFKVIIRKSPYTKVAVTSSDSNSDDGDSESDSDDSDMSDARSNASSDAPKKVLNQCFITGMAPNTAKAINYVREYEKNLYWKQTFKLPDLQFKFVETFKKTEIKMLGKKFNVDVVWPVHTVKPASSPSAKSKQNNRPVNRNALSMKGKKGDVEGLMKELNSIAQTLYEKSVQVANTVPLPVLLLERDELASQLKVVMKVITAKAAATATNDGSGSDSDDGDKPIQDQLQHTVIVVGSDFKMVSDACGTISGPFLSEVPNYTPQQFTILFKDLVMQNTKKSFQVENTVFLELDKASNKLTIHGRKVNVDAAQNSLQIRLNGKFLKEVIVVPKNFDLLMKPKNKSLFDSRQQGAKAFFRNADNQTELVISGDKNNVLALKNKLEDLKNSITKDLVTITNDSYAWQSVLGTDFASKLLAKYCIIFEGAEVIPSYDRASIHLANNIVIHLKKGDIFNETGSAIICCDNEDIKAMGGIAKLIADKTGPSMLQETTNYLSRFGKLMVGTAMTTSAGNLSQSFPCVIHVVGPTWSGGGANEHNLLRNAVRSVIDQAARNKMTKIVMPSISTGIFGYPKEQAAEVIAKELLQSASHTTTSLQEIVLVDMDNEMVEEFRLQFEKLHGTTNAKSYIEVKNQWYWLENNNVYVPYDADQNNQIELGFQTNQLVVQVVGDLNQVKNGSNYEVNFTTMKQRNLVTNWERFVRTDPLPPHMWFKIEAPALQATAGLVNKLHVNAIPSKGVAIKVTGTRSDVDQAVHAINNHIVSLTTSVQIDWHGGALDEKQTKFLQSIGVRFTIDKRKLILEGLSETLAKAQLELMKHAMNFVKYPDHWDDQTQNCQLFAVDAQSQEWASVASKFNVTMQNAQITKIERIQNKLIWEDYMGHVQKLSKMTGNTTELQLFHGTRNTDPKLIYTDTFSSPQCYWGYGNYFAVNSSYSHGYAHHLPNGSKQMFMATALVGDYFPAGSQTDSSLKVPPFKQAQNGAQQIRYDSVQGYTNGSTVYILYDNGRAYPSYLITYN